MLNQPSINLEQLSNENLELRQRLEEAEETLRAIQSGSVDALVIDQPSGMRVYTLEGADRPYRLWVEQMQQGAATLHTDGTISYCNLRLAELAGISHEKLIGTNLHDYFAAEDRVAYETIWRDPGYTGKGEVNLQRSDGTRIPVHLTFNALPKDCGVGTVGVLINDLTEQKHHEQRLAMIDALQISEERFRSLVMATTSIVWTMDNRGRFVTDQPSWSAYTGQSLDQLKDYGWFEAVHPDDRVRIKALLLTAYKDCSLFKAEGRLWHAESGTHRHFEIRGIPVFDASGEVREWVGNCTDIEAQVEAEKQVYGLMTELREADQRKDEFLATLAHELRGPLAPLGNMIEILKRTNTNPEFTHKACSTMERQLNQMVRLVDDLLNVSRINQGRIELKRERVSLTSIISQAVEACRPLAEAYSHRIEVKLPPDPIYLNADPMRLTQVFNNLLNNACKYTEAKGVISLSAEYQGNEVVVEVEDNGIGIPPAMLPQIFAMFMQVNQSLERSQGGLGIGLTLVKRLVELHDGTVTAYSTGLGQGSRFTVRLPVIMDKQRSKSQVQPAPAGKWNYTSRILVVDDNEDSANSLSLLLRLSGNETRTAYDGREAISMAEDFRPNALVLDIGLPELNGYDVARHIRQQTWGKDILLIALTGWGQEEDQRKSREAGFNAHMVKPVNYEGLMGLLATREPGELTPATNPPGQA